MCPKTKTLTFHICQTFLRDHMEFILNKYLIMSVIKNMTITNAMHEHVSSGKQLISYLNFMVIDAKLSDGRISPADLN